MIRSVAYGLAFTALTAHLALAQPTVPVPEPTVTATLDPPRVMVGQKITLLVTVLAPNYMPAPPVIPDFQVRNAATRALGAVNQTEMRDGTTYAGIRYEFAIYPQEPGSYALPNQQVTVTYAADPPNARKVDITLPRQTFEAFIPDAAQELDPFVSAESIAVEQKVERSAQDLKAGDSVKRAVTVKATGTPAMLLPPPVFAKVDGLALYPGQPSIQDHVDRRTGALSATRADEGTYMVERAGDYTLPAIELAWWNVRDGRIERTRAEAITLHVADNPAQRVGGQAQGGAPAWDWRRPILWVLDHWLLTFATLLLLGLGAWFAPAAARDVRQRIAAKQNAYRASEAWSFAQLRTAIRRRDAGKTYFALLDWLGRFAPARTVVALRRSAQDPLLDHEISWIDRAVWATRCAGRSLVAAPAIEESDDRPSPATPAGHRRGPNGIARRTRSVDDAVPGLCAAPRRSMIEPTTIARPSRICAICERATAGRYSLDRSDWENSRPKPAEPVSAATARPTGNRL